MSFAAQNAAAAAECGLLKQTIRSLISKPAVSRGRAALRRAEVKRKGAAEPLHSNCVQF